MNQHLRKASGWAFQIDIVDMKDLAVSYHVRSLLDRENHSFAQASTLHLRGKERQGCLHGFARMNPGKAVGVIVRGAVDFASQAEIMVRTII